MDRTVGRRDVLKTVVLPLVAVATGAFRDRFPVAKTGETMTSRPLMTVRIAAAPAQKLGAVPHGFRSIVPVTGGDFEGPRLRGRILPGGGDWLLLRPDGVLELDLRITLKTDDQALIYMRFQGIRHGPPEVIAALGRAESVDPAKYYFRTLPSFETSAENYAFLNRIISVGSGEAQPDGAVHRIYEIL
ncbi:MAG TPA: DUF3237 domain-containing protein [Gemmatimonadales bacterium]|jgi:hypothetical protein|nr:DUF3237 domain-containing protein [Gemmatimonadales bacterium]